LFALDAPPADAMRHFATLPGALVLERGDVLDTEAFTACLRRHAVDRLFPFAAVTSGPDRETDTPETVIQVNLLGFVSQMRAARAAGVRRVVAPSSGAIYGESAYGAGPLTESKTPPVPISIYGITKYAVERAALRLGALWGLDVVVARIGAVFGPWERDTGLRDSLTPFWQIERLARAGATAVLPAELPPYDWAYSRDIASGLLHLMGLADPAERVFSVASGQSWDGALLDWCRTLATFYPNFTWHQSSDAAECTVRLADTRPRATISIDRIARTGWRPAFTPQTALADYLAWCRTS
jgi:nucleoside-diphosphate-sugar epimerase